MKLILKYFREALCRFPGHFAASMGMIAALTAMETVVPWAMKRFLDDVTTQTNFRVLWGGIALFAGFLLVQILVNIQRFAALDKFGGRYIEYLSLSLESAMTQTPYSEIEKNQPQIIRNILYTDVLNMFRGIGHYIPSMIGAFAVMLASVSLGYWYDVRISLFISFAIVLGLLLSWSSRRVLAKHAGQTNAKLKIHDAWCSQFVDMLPLTQTHEILPYFQEKTRDHLRDFIETAIHEDKIVYCWTGLVSGYHSLFSIILSALLAAPAAGGSISNLVFFTMLANLAMQQAQSLESMFQQCVRSHPSFLHVEALRTAPARKGDRPLAPVRSVDFIDVSFAYPNGVQALKNVSCHMEAGDVILVRGSNGSGKSTFIKLLTGLYEPHEGRILLNGEPAEVFSQQSRNQQILYINQDEKLLNETFYDYLRLITGKDISDNEYSLLLEHMGLPDDDRIISGNGSSLSLGQRKKLLIIKMLLRRENASVIILDEVTAGLDTGATKLFYESVEQLAASADKIILLVDHALTDEPFLQKRIQFVNGKIE